MTKSKTTTKDPSEKLARQRMSVLQLAEVLGNVSEADPQPLETYQAFTRIFDEGINQKIPVVVADLEGHTDALTSAVFSPDGSRILTASEDGTAKVWPAPSYYETWINGKGLTPMTDAKKREYGVE